MKSLILIFLITFTQNLFADDYPMDFTGKYDVSHSQTHNDDSNRYLDCDAKNTVELRWMSEDTLSVDGLTYRPTWFKKINQGVQKGPTLIVGSSHSKSELKSTDYEMVFSKYSRTCNGDITGLTCWAKTWLETASLTIIKKDLRDGYVLEATFKYQPFENIEPETCEFYKTVQE